jgi:Tol biopolymer transport system component
MTFLRVTFSTLILSSSVTAMIALIILPELANSPASAAFPGTNGKIAYAGYAGFNLDIYVMNPDGSQKTRLTNNTSVEVEPKWSPDGTKLLFITDRDGGLTEIYVMDSDGNNQKRITNKADHEASPSWSPDGTKIIFTSLKNFCCSEIFVINSDGTGETQLTHSGASHESYARWSPDGSKIAFVRNSQAIWIMDSDGNNEKLLTTSAGVISGISWSPDGVKIAFATGPDRNLDIFSMNAKDGSDQIRLTDNPDDDSDPAWSPDGKKIVFSSLRDAGISEIYRMNSDGTNEERLTNNLVAEIVPDWQPLSTKGTVADATNQATGQSMYAGGRIFYGEKFGDGAAGILSVVDCATVELRKHGSPTGLAEIGFYDSNMNLVKQFGTIDVSTFTTGYKGYEFCLPNTDSGHVIQENQILAVVYDEGDPVNRIDVRRSNTGAGPDYDGVDSYHVNYDTFWHIYNIEGNSRDLLFKLTNS